MEEYLFAWILCGLGAAIIASNRGEKVGQWVFIGVFLGPIGVVVTLRVRSRRDWVPVVCLMA